MGDRYVLLVEDEAQRNLVYRWLRAAGVHRRDIVVASLPAGSSAGFTHVLRQYAVEVQEHRRKANAQARKLVVAIDADAGTVQDRIRQLDHALTERGLAVRTSDERICILVPKRHVETWILHLRGELVDEVSSYKSAVRNNDLAALCQEAGRALFAWFRAPPPEHSLPAMVAARPEVQRISSEETRLI